MTTKLNRRKICFFTGSRAEYGLLCPVIEKLKNSKNTETQLIVSGSHLVPEFGMTVKNIQRDGFKINKKVPIVGHANDEVGICHALGLGIQKIAISLKSLNPDLLVILGDRYEALAAATAGMILNIPIAHLYGGEITIGANDDAIRHAITKMSYVHFTSTAVYRKRVIQLGEDPHRVFNVGALGVENIQQLKLLSKNDLERKLQIKFRKHNLLIAFHPITREGEPSLKYFNNLLKVLDELKETSLIFTKSNADAFGKQINQKIDAYVSKHRQKSYVFASMGQLFYLSTMRFVDGLVGNSSSGIIEAPSFQIGTINVGDRQKGRILAQSVINCQPTGEAIRSAIKKLYSLNFQKILRQADNPYFVQGTPSKKIAEILEKCNLKKTQKKLFYDINFSYERQKR